MTLAERIAKTREEETIRMANESAMLDVKLQALTNFDTDLTAARKAAEDVNADPDAFELDILSTLLEGRYTVHPVSVKGDTPEKQKIREAIRRSKPTKTVAPPQAATKPPVLPTDVPNRETTVPSMPPVPTPAK